MTNKILILFFLIASLSAEIIPTNRMEEILPHIDEDTWVLFDIDNTLLEPAIHAGTVPWFHHQVNQLMTERGIDRHAAEELFLPEWDRFLAICPIRTPEPGTANLVKLVQELSGASLALTARHPPLANLTMEQLKKLQIDFSETAPSTVYLETSHPTHWENGVLFVSFKNPKGGVFRQFIEKSDWKPKNIVFIDDRMEHLVEMESELQQIGISFTGFHYTKALERIFDPEEATKQYQAILLENL